MARRHPSVNLHNKAAILPADTAQKVALFEGTVYEVAQWLLRVPEVEYEKYLVGVQDYPMNIAPKVFLDMILEPAVPTGFKIVDENNRATIPIFEGTLEEVRSWLLQPSPWHDSWRVVSSVIGPSSILWTPEQFLERTNERNSSINHPSHYNSGKIEVITFIEDQKLHFSLGNVIKYVCRAGKKDPSKTLEDLMKARNYLQFEIDRVKREMA